MKRRAAIVRGWMLGALLPAFSAGSLFLQAETRRPADPVPTTAPAGNDRLLEQAKQYVEASDRYLHHGRLTRGMKGYGRTVLAGVQIARFDVEILSVMTRWGPHTDVILAKLSGQGLQHSGLIAGMSGSPIYVPDPADGKDKLIGAVAYGWRGCKEPLCGIQPITQMLAVEGLLQEITAKPKATGPASRPASAPAEVAPTESAPSKDSLAEVLAIYGRRDGRRPWLAPPPADEQGSAEGKLTPLRTPLMVTGLSAQTLSRASEVMTPLGLVPLQGGGVGPAEAQAAKDAQLVPGAGLAVPLVTGDADMSAVGTVTDVIGQHVLGFGHPFFQEGDVKLPMGPAYVHSVIPGLFESFKLSTGLNVTGTITRDELTAVAGRVGPGPAMIPMTVTVEWPGRQRAQTYRYNLCQHPRLTAILMDMLLFDSVAGWRNLPEFHHVQHTVTIDFEALGAYRSTNVTSGRRLVALLDDAAAPVYVMLHNRFARPPKIRSIAVDVKVLAGDISGLIEDLRLDGQVYRPGQTLTGRLTLRRLRQPKVHLPVTFELPADLPEGQHTLTVCEANDSLRLDLRQSPHLFDPQTTAQLLQSIQLTVGRPNMDLYLRLPLAEGGLAIRKAELPNLPPSVAGAIADSRVPGTHAFERSLVRRQPTPYVINGSASASFTVSKRPTQTLIRQQKEPAP